MNNDITILIVDDDPDVLFATSRIVKSEGYEVLEAMNGAECMEIVRKKLPDLILLDVILPDVMGPELCRQIKVDPNFKGTFVILISGSNISSGEQAEGLDVGADGYIARPISNQELKSRVNAMVRILTAERERDRLIVELKEALSKIKKLSGLLPICAKCKKVRDDKGYWNQIDTYISMHSDVDFSHGLCPRCMDDLYSDQAWYKRGKKTGKF